MPVSSAQDNHFNCNFNSDNSCTDKHSEIVSSNADAAVPVATTDVTGTSPLQQLPPLSAIAIPTVVNLALPSPFSPDPAAKSQYIYRHQRHNKYQHPQNISAKRNSDRNNNMENENRTDNRSFSTLHKLNVANPLLPVITSLPTGKASQKVLPKDPSEVRRRLLQFRLSTLITSTVSLCILISLNSILYITLCRSIDGVNPEIRSSITFYFGILCPISSILLFLSPLSTVMAALRLMNPRILLPNMFWAQSYSCLIGMQYGKKADKMAIIITNLAGLCFQNLWLSLYAYTLISTTNNKSDSRKFINPNDSRTPVENALTVSEVSAENDSVFDERAVRLSGKLSNSRRSSDNTANDSTLIDSNNGNSNSSNSTSNSNNNRSNNASSNSRSNSGTGNNAHTTDSNKTALAAPPSSPKYGLTLRRWAPFISKTLLSHTGIWLFTGIFDATTVGLIGTVCNIVLFLIPLFELDTIIRRKNAQQLPLALVVMLMLSNIMWAIYGYIIEDTIITGSSVIGYYLSLFQFVVILWTRDLLPRFIDLKAFILREGGIISSSSVELNEAASPTVAPI